MKAIIVNRPGGYSRLHIEECLIREVGTKEVKVRTINIGVNYADCLVRLGLYKSAKELSGYPLVPGFDFSGEVVSVGTHVTRFKEGDRVYGVTLFGAYQTEIIVDQGYLSHIPERVTYSIAASLPTAFLTAFYIVENVAHLKKSERMLVRSVAGGVGSWLYILGKRKGAHVDGTVSTLAKKERLSREDVFLEQEIEKCSYCYDVIANAKGGQSIFRDFKKLNSKGRLILYGFHGMISTSSSGTLSFLSWFKLGWEYLQTSQFHPFTLVNQNKAVLGFNLSYLFNEMSLYQEAMDELSKIIAEGVEMPTITELPFHEVARAHKMMESGTTIGKLVLQVN
jgi:NADPH:quinone reductase-like Zn-dependent oxidoreductase